MDQAEPLHPSHRDTRVLLLESIHPNALEVFASAGFTNVERLSTALEPDALAARLGDVHVVGIRSRTELTANLMAAAPNLVAVGCFSIGTNQVNLAAARSLGIPVFNAPYSNTRSVAELVLGEMIMLFRGVFEKSQAAHEGRWLKTAKGSYELRGKTLGIVGYGHIGSQLSVLAESLGMRVIYHDIVNKLAIGNASPAENLHALLAAADVVSLHVPATPATANMIGPQQIAAMRPGALLINAARGNVIDIDALAAALRAGHLGGAAIDVFPVEPKGANDEFVSPLRGLPNVILTPHIGGSTQEAQANIGVEVASKLVRYAADGSTVGAVNFMEVSLPEPGRGSRFIHIHLNQPGVLAQINDIFKDRAINILGQYLRTDLELGYVVVDVDQRIEAGQGIRKALQGIPGTIRVRFLR